MTAGSSAPNEDILRFGPFELLRNQRMLLRAGKPVHLGGRAMDILIGLLERAGEVVSKAELMALAWPHARVDETNLRVHIAALRKLLGEGQTGGRCIVNVTGQGYLFAPAVTKAKPAAAIEADALSRPTIPGLLGRDAIVGTIVAQLSACRIVTITGTAGVGKTSVARAVSEAMFAAGELIHFVDLSLIEDPAMLPAAVAAALDVAVRADRPLDNLLDHLSTRNCSIILDNCEHLIDAAAGFVETLLERAPGVSLLATSREPLRVAGECVHQLEPLDIPEASGALTAERALDHAAVQLFVERATDSWDAFEFGDAEATAVADICIRLDGLPLAIELVAARIDLFGIRALATALDERLILVAKGSRTAQPRQQSMRGALDWSYRLLSDTERCVLRRLAIFRDFFTLGSAVALASDPGTSEQDVLDALASLAAKSLVAADTSRQPILYRLLHVTRAYAGEKLRESGEAEPLARRHARHFCDLLSQAEPRWETLTRSEWLGAYDYCADDVRAALDWAFSPGGDDRLAARLTLLSIPFSIQLSLLHETKRRIERAITIVRSTEPCDATAELALLCALATLALNATADPLEIQALFDRIALLAEQTREAKSRIVPLSSRAIHFIEEGDLARAIEVAGQLRSDAEAAGDPLAILLADRVGAHAHHHAGQHAVAKRLAEQVIDHPAKTIPLIYSQAPIERRITMRILLARTSWIEGRTQDAAALIDELLALAIPEGPTPLTVALGMGACPIAFWMGDDDMARDHVDRLIAAARRYTLDRLGRLGECFAEILHRRSLPSTGFDLHQPFRYVQPATQMQRELLATCESRTLDPALGARGEQHLCGLFNPEILRGLGEWHLRHSTPGATAMAEVAFGRALENARAQGALSWELRAATSLARLHYDAGRAGEARLLLEDMLGRLPAEVAGADLAAARSLLRIALQGSASN